ncbi:MAG: glycosyltransferase [Deltaproteobacteria bacterium]|nr:glycosyltransferase [Deltaproteobacteria bacterium]
METAARHSHSTAQYHVLDACPLCASKNLRPQAVRDDRIAILACADCDLRFVEKYPVDLTRWYDNSYYKKPTEAEPTIGYQDYEKLDVTYFLWSIALVRLFKNGGALFDLGCSNGLFLDLAAQAHFSNLSGVEFNPAFATLCRKKGYDVQSGDFLSASVPEDTFDVLTAWAVLEHIPDISATLTRIRRALKSDGMVFFEVPCLTDDAARDAHWLSTSLEHIYYFTPTSLRNAFKKHFGTECFGQVVHFPGYGSTFLGFATKDPSAWPKLKMVERALQGEQLPDHFWRSFTDEQIADVVIVQSRYLRNFSLVEEMGSRLGQAATSNIQTRYLGHLAEEYGKSAQVSAQLSDGKQYFLKRIAYLEEEVLKAEANFGRLRALAVEAEAGSSSLAGLSEIRRVLAERVEARIVRTEEPREIQSTPKAQHPAAIQLQRLRTKIAETLAQQNSKAAASAQEILLLQGNVAYLEEKVRALYDYTDRIHHLRWWKLHDVLASQDSLAKKSKQLLALAASWATSKLPKKRLNTAAVSVSEVEAPVVAQPISVRQVAWPVGQPLVSVIMPSYNYGRYMQQALDSLYAQTFQDFEILIVDCSDDPETLAVLNSIRHPKVTIHRRAERHQLGDNRNYGIARARGKYVCSLDPDDMVLPTYLEKAVYTLETLNCDIAAPSLTQFGAKDGSWILPPAPCLEEVLHANAISVVALFSKAIWEKAGGFHDYGRGSEHVHEDWDFWIRALAHGARVRNIQEPLMLYRQHASNMSGDKTIPPLDVQRERIKEFNRDCLTEEAFQRSRQLRGATFVVENAHVNLLRNIQPLSGAASVLVALPFTVVGGADKRFLEICQFLKDAGAAVSVVTTVPIDPRQHDTSAQFQRVTPDVFHLPRFLQDQEAWKDFVFYLLRTRNVSHLLLGGSQFFYDLLPELEAQFPQLKVLDQQFNTEIHFENNRRCAQWIDFTVAENEVVYAALQHKGEHRDRIALIPNGVDVHGEFSPRAHDIARPVELPSDKVIVSFIGRLSNEKGPDLFLAIAEALKGLPDLHFVLAGPGLLDAEMRSLIERYNLESRVCMPGHIDARQYLSATDILVVPSRVDGRPNIVLEALALGVPVVASAVGGIPSLVEDGETGFLCKPEEILAFAERIRELALQPELRRKLGEQAREFAVQNLDCSIVRKKYIEFFGL